MSKYKPFFDFLVNQESDYVRLTFAEIESILGSKLPATARTHARWWSNSYTNDSHTWAHLWMEAGWEKDELRLDDGWVLFRRVSGAHDRSERRLLITDLQPANLDATFSVETWSSNATIYMESRGPGRNEDYLPALEKILMSLAALGAKLKDVLIDSRDLADVPAAHRRLDLGSPYPIDLSSLQNVGDFRRAITRGAAKTGRSDESGGGGNPTKRLRMDLDVPGHPTAVDLAASLTADVTGLVKHDSGFVFEARAPVADDTPFVRTAAPATMVDRLHVSLQRRLYAALVVELGAAAVSAEHIVASGRPADIVVKGEDGITIYEIKTATTAKDCVRQAMGQLLEYAYWPGSAAVRELVVIGIAELDSVTEQFLEALRADFTIPVRYQQLVSAE